MDDHPYRMFFIMLGIIFLLGLALVLWPAIDETVAEEGELIGAGLDADVDTASLQTTSAIGG